MCFPTTQMIMFGNIYRHEMNMMTNEVAWYVKKKARFTACFFANNI